MAVRESRRGEGQEPPDVASRGRARCQVGRSTWVERSPPRRRAGARRPRWRPGCAARGPRRPPGSPAPAPHPASPPRCPPSRGGSRPDADLRGAGRRCPSRAAHLQVPTETSAPMHATVRSALVAPRSGEGSAARTALRRGLRVDDTSRRSRRPWTARHRDASGRSAPCVREQKSFVTNISSRRRC